MHLTETKKSIQQVIATGPFAQNWESLKAYQIPSWYEDAKFGIFIHWGVYSVPGFGNEWYPHNMYKRDTPEFKHHLETYGPQNQFGYKDFIPLFTAEHFDPDQWANLFRRAGARFVIPVAEHHDGFSMYDNSFSEWNTVKMGPKRDIIGELAEAVRKQWLTFGLSSHRAEHWWFFNNGMSFDSDVHDVRYAGLYGPAQPKTLQPNEEFLDDWLARNCELVDKYQPQVIWFDWWIEESAFKRYLQQFASYYYNRAAQWERGVAINYKFNAFAEDTAVFDVERGQLSAIRPHFWQTDTSISRNSWGYIQNHDYKTADTIIGDLVDIVSKNGALLLNIGPRPDGTIPEQEQKILLDIGHWLTIYGEAIYGTRPWKVFGEGPTQVASGAFTDTKRTGFTSQDIRFTTHGETLYAIILTWPENGTVTIKSLATSFNLFQREIAKVELIGSTSETAKIEFIGKAEELTWRRTTDGLIVDLPAQAQQTSTPIFALRISPAQ